AEVHQHPLLLVETLDPDGRAVRGGAHGGLDVVDDRAHEPAVGGVDDHEVLGDRQHVAHGEHDAVAALLLVGAARGDHRDVAGIAVADRLVSSVGGCRHVVSSLVAVLVAVLAAVPVSLVGAVASLPVSGVDAAAPVPAGRADASTSGRKSVPSVTTRLTPATRRSPTRTSTSPNTSA